MAMDKHPCHARPCGTDASDNQTMRIKDPTIVVPLFLVGGSILLGTVLTILNSMASIDPALLFSVMFIAILTAWSALNQWEGDQQLMEIQSEACKIAPDAPDQERAWSPPANARYGKEGSHALQWDLARDGWTLGFESADPDAMTPVDVFCLEHARR